MTPATTDTRDRADQPSGATTTASPSRRDAGTPLDGLRGSIAPPAISPLYRLGLAAVLLLLVLLPLIYLALVAGVAWLTWFHATQNLPVLSGRGGRGRLFLYATPLVTGALMLVFMIKPILARRQKGPAPIVVRPDQEPLLFAFIARICNILKAPVPSEVALDCQVNASASFRRGMLSFGSNDLTLTIGLPLAAGLSLRELAGVLAHEFGHFAQGAGMRATYLIRTINGWFARVVYERDAWDTWLERMKSLDFRLTLVIWIAQAGIWVNRRILQGLMMIGHACSCFMLRQMEYDADRYEIELAGTDTFISTSEKLPVLSVALMHALDDARNGWRAKRLPDDLPALVTHHDTLLGKGDRERLLEHQRQEKTGALDTHPSMRDRVAAATRLGRKGLFRSDAPSSTLFRDFEASSRAVTLQYYERAGVTEGEDIASIMVSTSHMAADTAAARQAYAAYETFFGPVLSPYRPMALPSFDELRSPGAAPASGAGAGAGASASAGAGAGAGANANAELDAIRERFRVAHAAARALSERARAANEVFNAALQDQHLAQRAGVLIAGGLKLTPADWRIPEATTSGVERALRNVTIRIDKQKPVLEESDRQLQTALAAALELIVRDPSPQPAHAGFRDELQRLLPVFANVSRALEDLLDISVYGVLLQISVEAARNGHEMSEGEVAFLSQMTGVLEPVLDRVGAACGDVPYPFDTATGEIALEQYVFGHDIPDQPTLAALVRATRLMDVLPGLQVRLLGRFAQMAQAIAR